MKTKKAIFGGGCFWGVEYMMKKKAGVLKTTVGYTGGKKENPTYEEVCSHSTGHIEALEIEYDMEKVDFETLAKLFFEIHDPTQTNGQGPDIGEQYLSVIFYTNPTQNEIAKKLINILEKKGYQIATKLRKAEQFWPAEKYHQNYYQNKGSTPDCHTYIKRFD